MGARSWDEFFEKLFGLLEALKLGEASGCDRKDALRGAGSTAASAR
jgi:hypothetical protein